MDFMFHLEDLTSAELQELIHDEEKINEFICDDDKLQNIKLEREMILAENRSIAEDNLSKEPRLLQLKAELEEKYANLKHIHDEYQLNQSKMASLAKDENLDTMLAVLQTKLAESEEKTESLVEKLFQNEIGINEFTASFKELRTLAHLRHIKADKMKELVLEIRRNGASNSVYQNTNPIIPRRKSGTNSSSTSPPYQLPYPPAHSPAYPHAQPAGQSYPQYSW